MANNERLKQIISNIRLLSDLTDGMKDSEIYPVSFFSQAFDLMQKIQSDFHMLEADQVEMFASQMKKHQALILSIHRQMRNIGEHKFPDETPEQKTPPVSPEPEPVATTGLSAPVTAGRKAGDAPVAGEEIVAGQNEDTPKKVSLLSRLGILKEEAVKDTYPETLPEASPEAKAPVVQPAYDATGRPPATKIMEEPVELPVNRPATVRRPIRPMPPKETVPAENIAVQRPERGVSATYRPQRPAAVSPERPATIAPEPDVSTITIPVTAKEDTAWPPVWPPVDRGQAGVQKTPEPKTQNVSTVASAAGFPPERSAPPSLNEAIEKRILSDLRRAFNVNDRFRYRRELFGGNEEIMNKVIAILNGKESYKDSIRFLEEKLHWDFSNPVVKDFIKVLEIRFL